MHISYIFIIVEKTKSLYAYNDCLSLEIVRSSDVFIKHNFDKHVWTAVEIMFLKKTFTCYEVTFVKTKLHSYFKNIQF